MGNSSSKEDFKYIQTTFMDLTAITRCIMTTKYQYDTNFKKNGFSYPYFGLSLPYMHVMPYERVNDDVQLFVDDEDPRPVPWLEGTGIIFGRFYNGGKPWDSCPRTFLIKQEEKLAELNIQLQIGFEIEFYLVNLDGSRINCCSWGEPKAMRGKVWNVLTEVVDALGKLGIPVWKFHPESGFGQYELPIGTFKGSMLKAADSLILTKQAIYSIAAKYEYTATFLPQPFTNDIGSAVHTHVSFWRNDKNLFEIDPNTANSFLGGIFQHLPDSMLIFNPNGNSYDRYTTSSYTGSFHCIGKENRKAAIRVFEDDNSVTKRFEIRNICGTSNPHLLLGAIIGSGIDGIQNNMKLPKFVDIDPMLLPEDKRPPLLPSSLSEAITTFRDSAFNKELYGSELLNVFVKLRTGEDAYWKSDEESMEEKMKFLINTF